MKNKLIALIAAAALGICGCSAQDKPDSESLNVIDAGKASIGSSEGVISYGSSTSHSASSGSSPSSSSDSSSSDGDSSSSSSSIYSSSSVPGKSSTTETQGYDTPESRPESSSSASSSQQSSASTQTSYSSSTEAPAPAWSISRCVRKTALTLSASIPSRFRPSRVFLLFE